MKKLLEAIEVWLFQMQMNHYKSDLDTSVYLDQMMHDVRQYNNAVRSLNPDILIGFAPMTYIPENHDLISEGLKDLRQEIEAEINS